MTAPIQKSRSFIMYTFFPKIGLVQFRSELIVLVYTLTIISNLFFVIKEKQDDR